MLNSRELKVFITNQTDGQRYKQISYKQKSVIMKVLQNEAIRLLQYYEALSMLKPLRISIQLHSAFLCLSVALQWAKLLLPSQFISPLFKNVWTKLPAQACMHHHLVPKFVNIIE